jgi:hypothetical protein
MRIIAPWGTLSPLEKDELGFKSTFDTTWSVMQLSVESITLSNEDREGIFNWIYQGQGRFENIPVTIESDTLTKNYYLDLKTCGFTDTDVSVSVYPRKGANWFWEQADNLTFDAIQKNFGTLVPSTVQVPYLVVKPDLVIQTLMISITTFSLVTEIARTIKAITDLSGQALDVVGTGALTTVIQTVALVAYLVALSIALINLITQLVRLFFPKLRYFKAMRDYDLIRLGCQSLGFTLDSTLLAGIKNKLLTLPIPMTREQNRPSIFEFLPDDLTSTVFNLGYPTASDTTPTLGEFIRQTLAMFNAEAIAYEGVLKLETRDWFEQNPVSNLELYFNEQSKREQLWGFDTEMDWKRKTISWQTDYSDLHTADNFYKVATEINTKQLNPINNDLVSITGYKDIPLVYSLGSRKRDLNFVEKLVKGLFTIADVLVNLFGGTGNFASSVTNRIGVLQISEETFSITKKLWCTISSNVAKQDENFILYLGTDSIYNTYHRDQEVKVNSSRIFEEMPIPMTEYEFSQFSQNKFVNLNSTTVELLQARFEYDNAIAYLTYRDYDNSGFNTEIEVIY